jgi:serine/threonine protein kinase
MSESEQLREALLDLERARLREAQRRVESTSVQQAMSALTEARDLPSVFSSLVAAFRTALDFSDAFVLTKGRDGRLHTAAATVRAYEGRVWVPDALFERVMAGAPAAVFDVRQVEAWRSQPEVVRGSVLSALHVQVNAHHQAGVLVFTHGKPGAFGPRQLRVAERFAPIVSQALLKRGPDRWAHYEILERIGVGGMGEVFLARQRLVPGLERLVILKTILPKLARHMPFVHQFLDEARVAATLNHPNIVSIYEVGEGDGEWFIAMEYIRGVDLLQLLQAAHQLHERVPPGVAAAIVRDAALGLHHAHMANDGEGRPLQIVHRDVSPQNVMVRIDGLTKVLDFGIAKSANRLEETVPGTFRGKISYMSPEQAMGEEVDARSDQFSLGIVLWELLTGERLFHADSPARTMRRLMGGAVPRPSTLAPEVEAPLEDIVMRMLRRRPDERFADCAAVAAALDRLLRDAGFDGDAVGRFVRRCVEELTDLPVGEVSGRIAYEDEKTALTGPPEMEPEE